MSSDTNINPAPAAASGPWLTAFDAAIERGDDKQMWHLLGQHHDQEAAHDWLTTQVARLSYAVSARARFSELFLLPVISAPGSSLPEEALWREADYCIGEALDTWLGKGARKTVFSGVRPYAWIGAWRPAVLRCHLNSAVPGRAAAPLSFLTETLDLPEDAPVLGFVCMVLTGQLGWPQLPPASTARDDRFKLVTAGALQQRRGDAPTILTPDRLQYAVADGLGRWLMSLHEAKPITGWTVAPMAASPDVVKVTLAFDDDFVPVTQFTLRKHQIGLNGVSDVLSILTHLAPMLDVPTDVPQGTPQHKTIDLTSR